MNNTRRPEPWRLFELGLLLAFLAAVLVLMLVNPASGVAVVEQQTGSEENTSLQVYASAMPHQGWAPLTVYFSAFGSQSPNGEIQRYEWDLDGNGRYDTDATASGGYASYTYTKPGLYIVTLRVTDPQGQHASQSIPIQVRHPASSSVDYWTLFDDSRVRKVEIFLSQADWNYIWTDPEAKLQVRADAIIFGERLDDIGFRMRGQFSLRNSGEKKPWKIDTDAYIEGQEYHNLRQLMFLNNIGDSSLLQEKLAYDGMHFAGVPASFTCFVELWIDFVDDDQPPIFWGVYTMVERVDKKFLSNRFGQDYKGGNLYKANHAQRGPMDLVYHGPQIEDYPTQNGLYAYGKATNEATADYSDLLQLIYTIDGVDYESPEAFASALEEVLNVDSFLRYMAVVNTLGNWDSYPYTGNNYYLFYNAGSGRFEWLPWDLTWGDNPQHPLFDLEGPGLVEQAPLYEKVFQVERYRVQYAAYLDLLARYWFTPENIAALAGRYQRQVAPYLTQGQGDQAFFGPSAMFPSEAFNNSAERFVEFTRLRNAFIRNTLTGDSWRTPPVATPIVPAP
ncbi:MAG: CotH kinase family protein [Anaerolineales bacterium]|nr:CotH kinase family protein [Anaerolineales bacterium]